MSKAIVDLQFIIGNNNQYFLKEIAFVAESSLIPILHVFKPPYPKEELCENMKKQNSFNKRNINGLSWEEGNIEYSEVGSVLRSYLGSFCTIYVKGLQKKEFLCKYLPTSVEIINLDDSIPSLQKLQKFSSFCPFHDSNQLRCAVKNVMNVYMHLIKDNVLF